MKKVLFLLLLTGVWAFPYAVLVGMYTEHYFILLGLALGLVCAVALLVLSRRGTWTARQFALGSMAVKLLQIPAYVVWFLLGVLFLLFMGAGLAFVVDALAITLSGIVGLSAVLRCRAEGKLTQEAAIVNGILQFIFCVDVFSAIWVYRKSKEFLS